MLNKIIRQNIEELDNQVNNICYTARKIKRKSMVDLQSTNIFNMACKNNKNPNIFINSTNSKICPESTNISSNDCQLNSSKIFTKQKNLISRRTVSKNIKRKDCNKTLNKLSPKQKSSNNIKFIHQLLFKSQKSKDNKINFYELRNILVKNQKTFNEMFESYSYVNINNENEDMIQIKRLENLIVQYIIIIYFLLKVDFEEAQKLFLLMIKENKKYIKFFEYKLYKTFSKEKRMHLLKTYPKTAISLFKIFSSIIKYSSIFNKTRYRNMFLFKYLSLHSLNYRIFRNKCQMRGFSTETKNNIKYWFSLGLHYASYFILCNYISLKIPIVLSELIIKVYKNEDESILNSLEKTILVKTLYNNSLLLYINGHSEQSLKKLEATKHRIISFYYEIIPPKINNSNLFNNTSVNNINKIMNTNSINYGKNILKRSLFLKMGKNNLNNSFISPENIFDKFDKMMNNSYRKNSLIRMENINSLFSIEFQKNCEKKLSITENDPDNLKKFKNEFGENGENLLDEFNSGVNVKPLFDINNCNIPNYMKNPILIKIELLMCEIEIDKKNFYAAYEHIKTSIIIMFIIKNIGEYKVYDNFKEEIRIMLTYLNQIEELNDKRIQKRQKSMLTKSYKNKSNITLHNHFLLNKDNSNKHINFSNYSIPKINQKDLELDNKTETKNEFLAKEIKKIFLFLNSLSMYQIKLLNDFQPKTENKNDLPIIFHNQFKDSLSASQRVSLEKLQTMTLSRYMILEDPDKPILPTNLKFEIITNKKLNIHYNRKKTTTEKDDIYSSNSGDNDDDFNMARKTKENEIFQKIILSKNNNIDLRKFIFQNYDYVIKIVKESSDKEIENIIEDPKIIVEPIKLYLKKHKKDKMYSMSVNRQCLKINDFNYLFRNSTIAQELKNRLAKNSERKRMKSSFYTIDDFCFGKKNMNRGEKSRKYTYKKPNHI